MDGFGSQKIIKQQISEAQLATYLVGYDLDDNGKMQYRIDSLINILVEVIPEFAFGFHEGSSTINTKLVSKVRDAARAIYKIDVFQQARDIYSDGKFIDDTTADRYLRRGEFGELILHLILRDFHSTIPLLSKIHFKDSYGHAVHGFDAVHIQEDTKTLWLGESKLYLDGQKGVKALIQDIKEHFVRDYLNDEFSIVSNKLKPFDNIPKKDYWLNLLDNSTKLSEQLNSINIPLLCVYTSENFSKYNDERLKAFIDDYEKEVRDLKSYFDSNNNHPLKTDLNIILLLFPVKCKIDLVHRLHRNLSIMQSLGGI